MPYTAADGPPSHDATHAWSPATGPAPPTLNDQTVNPRIVFGVEGGITGWRVLPEADDNREARTTTDGEIPYPGKKLGKTIVYEMTVYGDTLQAVSAVQTSMLNGYGDMSGLGTMTVTPYPHIGGVTWQFQARVLSLDFDNRPEWRKELAQPWRWGFALSLRMMNPFFYTPNLAGAASL